MQLLAEGYHETTHPPVQHQLTVDVQGLSIPKIGIGTWTMRGEECTNAIEASLEQGYRHIDTAQVYENEGAIGAAMRRTSVPRDQIWITTKVARSNASPRRLRKGLNESLKHLGVQYIDLLLIHWPNEEVGMEKTLNEMTVALEKGMIRSIGVSNFTPSQVIQAITIAPIFCLQVEMHPFLDQTELLSLCQGNHMAFIAYSPLAQGKALHNNTIQSIAREHEISPSQVVLAWLFSKARLAAIPKASSHRHRAENLRALEVRLTHDELQRIDGLERGERLIDPEYAPDWEDGQNKTIQYGSSAL